jgi:hypothetical protein
MDQIPASAGAKSVTIVDTTIPVIEYQGQRVITLAMVDRLHRRPDGTAKRNLADNKERFVEGKHFYLIDYSKKYEFRTFGIDIPPRGLTVLTERGYSMLVKSFSDDFAWEVQEQLVDSYFDAHKPMSTAEFLVQQANLILEHEKKIAALQQKQIDTDVRIAETRQELRGIEKKATEAFEAATAALIHRYGQPDYYSIMAFCAKHGIRLTGDEAKVRGAQAAKISRDMDKEIIKIPDERYGRVGSYHESVLMHVFMDKLKQKAS